MEICNLPLKSLPKILLLEVGNFYFFTFVANKNFCFLITKKILVTTLKKARGAEQFKCSRIKVEKNESRFKITPQESLHGETTPIRPSKRRLQAPCRR